MSEIEKKPIKITETVLRDAHQSLIATRMTTEQMLPIIDKMEKVGAEEDPTNFLLMHAMGPNVAGVIGTAVAAGCFMAIFGI